ncbi:MAG TPA: DJ-1/PfpI family protein, partial [Allosphingosinicella sp.]
MPAIAQARILIIAADGFEDSELLEPRRILRQAGAEVTLASLEKGEIEGDNGATVEVDAVLSSLEVSGFHALLLPG